MKYAVEMGSGAMTHILTFERDRREMKHEHFSSLWITELLNCVHRSVFWQNTTLRKLDFFLPHVEGRVNRLGHVDRTNLSGGEPVDLLHLGSGTVNRKLYNNKRSSGNHLEVREKRKRKKWGR
jgi:hypothetical protein